MMLLQSFDNGLSVAVVGSQYVSSYEPGRSQGRQPRRILTIRWSLGSDLSRKIIRCQVQSRRRYVYTNKIQLDVAVRWARMKVMMEQERYTARARTDVEDAQSLW